MEQVIFGGVNAALDASTTQYAPLVGANWNATEFLRATVVSTGGKIKNLRVKLAGAPGAGKSYDFTLMVNGSPTALTVEIANAATTGSDATSVDVSAGDIVSLRCVPTGTPTAVKAYWTTVFEGTTASESLIMGSSGGSTLNTASIVYSEIGRGDTFPSTTENDFRQVCPTAGTIKNLYVELSADPGTSPDAYRFTVRLNGATVGESLIVTITADGTTGNDTSHNLVVAAGDILTMMIEPLNSPSETPTVHWGMTFVADTDGESIILGGTTADLNDTATRYAELSPGSGWSAIEGEHYFLGQACTLKKLYIKLSGTPGSGKKYTFTARIAAADSNVVAEVADTATTGNSSALEDTVADDEYVTLKVVPTSTPTVRDAYWGLVSFRGPVKLENKSANMAAKMMAAGVI